MPRIKLKRSNKLTNYRTLAEEAVRFRGPGFWQYLKKSLKTVGESLDWPYLFLQIGRQILWMLANPGTSALLAIRFLKRQLKWSGVAGN